MIEISTTTNHQCNDLKESCPTEGLSAEEDQFFSTVKNGLDKIAVEPSSGTIEKLLTYSKSL